MTNNTDSTEGSTSNAVSNNASNGGSGSDGTVDTSVGGGNNISSDVARSASSGTGGSSDGVGGSSDGGLTTSSNSAGGTGGEGASISGSSSAGGEAMTATATTGMVCLNGGYDREFCLTQEQMEEQARYGYTSTPMDPPRTDAEIAEAWDEQGCLPTYWVGSTCCNPGIQLIERRGDQCCYVSCEGEFCCGQFTTSMGSTGGP